MEVDSTDPKNLSLADIIKQQKAKGGRGKPGGLRGGKGGGKRPQSARSGKGGNDRQGGRPRFGSNEFKNKKGDKKDLFKAKRTGNMITKQGERPRFDKNREKAPVSNRKVINKADTTRRGGFRTRGGGQQKPERGGLARGPRKVLAAPKQQRTLRIGGPPSADKKLSYVKTKTLRPSDVRLKVRNIDEKQVTNEDLMTLFAKIGELQVCRFDRNEFGQFLGSATVTYQRPECAKHAITEYHGALLDDKVLTVEYDMVPQVTKVVKPANGSASTQSSGAGNSTLRVKKQQPAATGKTIKTTKS